MSSSILARLEHARALEKIRQKTIEHNFLILNDKEFNQYIEEQGPLPLALKQKLILQNYDRQILGDCTTQDKKSSNATLLSNTME